MHSGSHVHEIVACLKFLRESRVQQASWQEVSGELEVRLCELMQKMITGPLTGQMFVPSPVEFLSAAEVERSLTEQTTV